MQMCIPGTLSDAADNASAAEEEAAAAAAAVKARCPVVAVEVAVEDVGGSISEAVAATQRAASAQGSSR